MSPDEPELTVLLRRAGAGDRDAADRLFRAVEAELRARARACLRHESTGHSLQTTLLIDGAFQQLVGRADIAWEDRAQFLRYAARAMRHILVDHARERIARDKGLGGRPARLEDTPTRSARAGSTRPPWWPSTRPSTGWPGPCPSCTNWSSCTSSAGGS
ncbi:MAG: hypothetical protein K2X82_14710 [Gemmataceae bacterium]|nr:hypothetical protein [Gemmataceae bacterium]